MQSNKLSTLFIGQKSIHLAEVDSTNNFLKNLVSNSEPLPEGAVIMADAQSAGRGQADNVWHAEKGKNLTISILLKPTFLSIEKQFDLNIAISIGVCEAMQMYLPEGLSIKWPNDIYYKDKKIGGILIENIIIGTVYKTAIVGIGLNINQQTFHTEIKHKAISLFQILNKTIDLNSLFQELCNTIEANYIRLLQRKHTELLQKYLNLLYKLNENNLFRQNDEIFEGKITGITENGRLIIDTNHKKRIFDFKEVEFITQKT